MVVSLSSNAYLPFPHRRFRRPQAESGNIPLVQAFQLGMYQIDETLPVIPST